jgi:hypothetical protein
MRYITGNDEELIKTINLVCHFPGRAAKMLSGLENNYRKYPENAEAAFAYGFLLFLLCSKTNDSVIGVQNLNFEAIFDVFNQALKLIPDYWLVWMFKVILLLSLPEIMQEEKEFVNTIETMIGQQNQADRKEPYFMIPYVIFADYKYSRANRKGAVGILNEGMKAVPQTSIQIACLHDYLVVPFKDYMKRLVRSNEFEMALQVQSLGSQYFPNEAVFKTNIRQGWL